MQQISIKSQINKELDILTLDMQKKVLDFVFHLSSAATSRSRRKDGEELVKFAGLLGHEEAEELAAIINENCDPTYR